MHRVPTAQGKRGKMAKKNPCQGNFVKTQGILSKHRETQGILLTQVVNALILKVKDIAIVTAKKSIFSQKLDRSVKSVLSMQYSQIM